MDADDDGAATNTAVLTSPLSSLEVLLLLIELPAVESNHL